MLVTFEDGIFIAHAVTPIDKRKARDAGFFLDEELNHFTSPCPEVAAKLREHMDEVAKKQHAKTFITVSPWLGRITHPDGLTPLPFQPPAARFALERNRSYLALDPGLGKTIVAALILNALGRSHAVFIVPPFLAINTKVELEKWCTWKPKVCIYGHDKEQGEILVVPDSMMADPLGKHNALWEEVKAKGILNATLFVDEAQRFKSVEAQRTETLSGKNGWARHFNRIVFLSGTPMPNRPMELYGILSRFAPETIGFRNHYSYGMRYCAGFHDGFGYDFSGASNVQELAEKVRATFMLRLRKKDVLRDLPPKTEELVILAEDAPKTVVKLEKELLAKHSPEDLMAHLAPNGHTSTYRHELGIAKAPLAVVYLKEILTESNESVLIFAEHTKVIERLAIGLAKYHPLVITGQTPKHARQGLVNEFQTNPKRRVFIGNTKACGVGFTLTKATRVIMVEASWVPGENEQATDRAHRIGQKDNVLVQYLVFKNSIDRAVMETNLRKRKTINVI